MSSERLTVADRSSFFAALRRIAPMTDEDLAPIDAEARVRRLEARTLFLECGAFAVDTGSVVSGLVREYFPLEDGREVTRGFAGPGEFVGSLSDLITGKAALSSAVAELDSRLVVVPWRLVKQLVAQRPNWAACLSRVTERLYLAKATREYELLALDAEARYQRFRAKYASLEPAIPLRHVASYVGITPEHLSRLRRRLAARTQRQAARKR